MNLLGERGAQGAVGEREVIEQVNFCFLSRNSHVDLNVHSAIGVYARVEMVWV